jgi:hypothetical protein
MGSSRITAPTCSIRPVNIGNCKGHSNLQLQINNLKFAIAVVAHHKPGGRFAAG